MLVRSRVVRVLTIKNRLPLMMGLLLLGMIVSSVWVSYDGVKESSLEASRARLRMLTTNVAAMVQQSARNVASTTLVAAKDRVIRDFVNSPSSGSRAGPCRILEQLLPPQDPNALRGELWNTNHSLVMALPEDSSPISAKLDNEFKQSSSDPLFAVGEIKLIGDKAVYPIVAAIRDDAGQTVGYLVKWRRLVATAEARQQFVDAMGNRAALYIGNNEGEVWTDLVGPASEPPLDVRSAKDIVYYTREGSHSVVALSRPISGTPWYVLLEFAAEPIFAQSGLFLWRVTVVGLIVLAIGLASASMLSRSIARPLDALTKAASEITAGGHSRLVEVSTRDELGELAKAFNTMVVRLRDTQRDLERQVQERTAELHERRHAEDALRRSEERYRDLFENANDMIFTHDLNGYFTSINKRGEMLTGYARHEFIGMNIGTITAPGYLALVSDSVSNKTTGGEQARLYETEIITKDGRLLPVEVNARLIYEGDQPVGVQGIARDISERKQLEDQLRHSQKMEAIGRLAGGIAHDFNNLLTAIIGYSQLALGRLSSDDAMRKEIDEINNAGLRAAALTNQLLAFSRKQLPQPRVLDLNVSVCGLQKMLQRLIGEDLQLIIKPASDRAHVKADPGHVEQVIMNLAVNARDAMDEGGTLTIETTVLELETGSGHDPPIPSGPYVVLSINDTGAGMDPETMSHIFEPFFTTKEQGKGTGLGLSTVYGIVKQSGGHISVASKRGRGTTFKVWLPRVEQEAEPPHREESNQLPRGTETVLLVEDDELVRKFAGRVLRELGYTLLEASNGEEALDLIQEHEADKIDLMLTDVVMPQLGGKALADRVRCMRPEVKVLFASGHTDKLVPNGKLGEEMDSFLHKPFTPSSLADKVRHALDA